MSDNQQNALFQENPYIYITKNIVNNTGAGGDGHLVYGVARQVDGRLNLLGGSVVELAGEIGRMKYDFMAARVNGEANILLRPAVGSLEDEIKKIAVERRAAYAKRANKGNDPAPPSDSEIDAVMKAIPRDPDNLVEGYYFPYRGGNVKALSDMGQISVPKKNPLYKFVFTGAMNGCHLVVAEDPNNPDNLMFYHYQSARSNPIYLTPRNKTGKKTIGQHAAFGTVYYWLTNEEYGGDPNDITQVNGFNFFFYKDDRWWACSLPLKTGRPGAEGLAMHASDTKPFAFAMNY